MYSDHSVLERHANEPRNSARYSFDCRFSPLNSVIENLVYLGAALPGLYALVCLFRRSINAQRTARWVRQHHRFEWDALHWLAKRHARAGVEVLITKKLISGPMVDAFRARDEALERASWVGLLVSAALLLVIVLSKIIVGVFS